MDATISMLNIRLTTLETQINSLDKFVGRVNAFIESSKDKEFYCACTVCKAIVRSTTAPWTEK